VNESLVLLYEEYRDVDSSWIQGLEYDEETGEFLMHLNSGRSYQVQDADEELFDEWSAASSKGKFWWANVTGAYMHTRVA
jgi:hypothetical protein